MAEQAKLYVVATPIGNLGDITVRALAILKEVDLIAAEDTRESKKLLQYYGITTSLLSLHAHNEKSVSNHLVAELKNNRSVAYITDAGTPLISDPGAYLVAQVRRDGFAVVPIPGPCAAIAALSVAGLQHPQFYFEGFLPHKRSSRQKRLRQLQSITPTLIFYESPHRIMATLSDLLSIFGNCCVVVARELTKKFETILTGRLQEVINLMAENKEQQRGEFVILVSMLDQEQKVASEKKTAILNSLLTELSLKRSVAIASELLDIPKNELYALAIELKK